MTLHTRQGIAVNFGCRDLMVVDKPFFKPGVYGALVLLAMVIILALPLRAGQFVGLRLADEGEILPLEAIAAAFPASNLVTSVKDIPAQRLQQALDQIEAGQKPQFTSSPSAVKGTADWWTRFSVQNTGQNASWRLMLQDAYPGLFEALVLSTPNDPKTDSTPSISIYRWQDEGLRRDMRYGQIGQSLVLDLAPGQRHEVYVLVATSLAAGKGLSLQAEHGYRVAERESMAQYALATGMLFVLVVALFISWAVMRRQSLLYLAIYGLGILVSASFWYGTPFLAIIFPAVLYDSALGVIGCKLGLGVAAVMGLLMCDRLLDAKRQYPVLSAATPWLAGIVGLLAIVLAFVPVPWLSPLQILVLPVILAAVLLTMQATVAGKVLGRWLLAGFLPVLAVVILLTLSGMNLLPDTWLTPLDLVLAVSFQLMLLFPAMGLLLRDTYTKAVQGFWQLRHEKREMARLNKTLETELAEQQRRYTDMKLHWDKAVTDPLTGARNIVAFELDVQKLAERIQHQGHADVPVVMVNIDGIKPINALRGRRAGDTYIARFAHLFVDALLGKARLYRLGGDEFALLPAADSDLETLVDDISQALEGTLGDLVRQGYVMAHASLGQAWFSEADNQAHKVTRLADEDVWRNKKLNKGNAVIEDRAVAAFANIDRDSA